jgi:integrase
MEASLKYKPAKDVSKEKQKELLLAAKAISPNAFFLAAFYLHTGLRVSEGLSITLGDIRAAFLKSTPKFKIETLKKRNRSKEVRDVYLSKFKLYKGSEHSLYSLTKEYLKTREHHPDEAALLLAPSYKTGLYKPLTRGGVHAFIKKLFKKIGDPEGSPHTLRHAFAYNLFDRQVPMPVIQQLMGHDSLQSLGMYIMARERDILEAVGL